MPACDRCARTFKGFGTTCSTCRKNKGGGLPKDCERCGTFFVGFGDHCSECESGRGPGRTGVPLPSPAEVDAVMDKIDTCIKKVDLSQESTVKLRKAEFDLLTQLEAVRDLMERILKSGDRQLLKNALGDCGRVARLRVYLDTVKFSDMNAKDGRHKMCNTVCKTVEDMVRKELGMEDEYQKAEEETNKKMLMSRLSVVMDPKKHQDFAVSVNDKEMQMFGAQRVDGEWIDPTMYVDSDDDDWYGQGPEEDWDDDMKQYEAFEANVRRLFDELDADGNGQLTRDEVKNAAPNLSDVLKACHIYKRKHIVRLFEEGDMDGDGTISFHEFLDYIVAAQERAYQNQAPKLDDRTTAMIFQTMDKDGDGTITCEELKMAYAGILLRSGEPVDVNRVNKWAKRNFKKYDKDGSNALDFQEFKALIQNSGALAPMVEAARQNRACMAYGGFGMVKGY